MARDSVTFEFNSFITRLNRSVESVLQSAVTGVHDATDDLLALSREEAPLQEGTLRATAGTEVTVEGDEVVGEVYYSVVDQSESGERFNYAIYQHELGENYKRPTTPGTRPKFLERPLKANSQRYNEMIADAVRKGL
ncbi:hypothetical protein DCC85_14280 [Paenibacillus sp. CAA11]|uniref:hypothetical protein n=1 Tax=Paenibacillus sp. CAA11 TaxID=1532905 RepID=UPI000D3D7D63|nr:hypothetical protein [Paenibacillus sp. CAA11]AWB45277.1 hypothetical protein DCC85_14280 [Paenibacillus sp. CAA11]